MSTRRGSGGVTITVALAFVAAACTAAEAAARAPAPLSIKGHYEHPMSRWNIALRISDPWHAGDYFLYRMPEALHVDDRAYLAQKDGVDQWAGPQPDSAPEWRIDPAEKSTSYAIRFHDGIGMSVEAWIDDDAVTFRYVIRNGTAAPIRPGTGSCFMLWTAPQFVDRRHERTFVWVNKKPVALNQIPPTPAEMQRWPFAIIGVGRVEEFPETKVRWVRRQAADHGLICVQSQDRTKTIGLAWAPGDKFFARSTLPCIHSEPKFPAVPPGQALQSTGRLYFSNDGMAAILKRFEADSANGVIHGRVIP